MTATPRMPPEALQKLTRLEIAAQTAQQSAAFTVSRVSDIDSALGLNPGRSDAEALKLERGELVKQRISLVERAKSATNLLANIRAWMAHTAANRPSVVFEMAPVTNVAPRKGETTIKALQRVRAEVQANKLLQGKIKHAPPSKEELKQMASAWTDRIVSQLKPTYQIEAGGVMRVDVPLGDAMGGLTATHVLGMLTMVCPDQVLTLLEKQIDAQPDVPDAIPLNERTDALRKLADELDALEREEEGLVVYGWLNSQSHIERRPDCSPAAILGIRVAKPKVKTNGAHLNGAKKKSEPRVKLLPKHQRALDELEDQSKPKTKQRHSLDVREGKLARHVERNTN
ncbi:MAG: hypothetical protein IT536_08305 [Hyphomicrobiales bacterium]|nr:hypothetical protein [Hyphomicrobiales bacterium]